MSQLGLEGLRDCAGGGRGRLTGETATPEHVLGDALGIAHLAGNWDVLKGNCINWERGIGNKKREMSLTVCFPMIGTLSPFGLYGA